VLVMRYYGKAEEVANQILSAFKAGNLPQALSTIFIKRNDERPSSKWSWSNQLLALLANCSDARGFRQWEAVGRHVAKGEKSRCSILVPMVRKETREDGTERSHLYGYKAQCVFDIGQTTGADLPPVIDEHTAQFLDALPLRNVARDWGINVDVFSGENARYLGFYRYGANGKTIALGVASELVFLHELCHASDHRLGNLVEKGQKWSSEVVAQMGASVLMLCLGYTLEADLGKTYAYIEAYATAAGLDVLTACLQMLRRTCCAVAEILKTADELSGVLSHAVSVDSEAEECAA